MPLLEGVQERGQALGLRGDPGIRVLAHDLAAGGSAETPEVAHSRAEIARLRGAAA